MSDLSIRPRSLPALYQIFREGGNGTSYVDADAPNTVIVAPRQDGVTGWIVYTASGTVALADKLSNAKVRARAELARLGGGDLEVHLRYGRTRRFRHVGVRAAGRFGESARLPTLGHEA